MYRHGWYQVAFERDLTRDVTPAAIGDVRLALIRTATSLRAIDAACPHRGADLSAGSLAEDDEVVCPFHAFRIGIGRTSAQGYCAREFRTLTVGGLVFVQLTDAHDLHFASEITQLAAEHTIIAGFALKMRGAADLVVENAFDQAHFRPVHGIGLHGSFQLRERDDTGPLEVVGHFILPRAPIQRGLPMGEDEHVPFVARAFSPGLVISDLGGATPYGVLTASTPGPDGEATIRLSLIMPRGSEAKPQAELCDHLLRRSRSGLEKDRLVWDRMIPVEPNYSALDRPVRAFRDFCAQFAAPA